MNLTLGLRALALLAFVAATTVVIVKPDLIGGAANTASTAVNPVLPLGRT